MALSPELAAWRKAERARLIAARMALSVHARTGYAAAIDGFLRRGFPLLARASIGLCWPFQGEYDARPVAAEFRVLGARLALPSVVAKATPLEFLEWWPGVAMRAGVYDIPVPAGTERVVPQVLLIPVVGVGAQGDRLGYGGGFYDRTLAAIAPRPICIAIAHEVSRVSTTYPQDHDILMDFVVTETGIEAAVAGGLERVDESAAARRAEALWAARYGAPVR
ncbi:MAG: 5-formyltetrahydrofolate cyclo-ligase [Pseudomonadota bacterium]|jgi:5-formyltetrahydrofolate cyclo-ligase